MCTLEFSFACTELKVLRRPKILASYFFYFNLHLHFLRLYSENIFNIVCIVSEKSGKYV